MADVIIDNSSLDIIEEFEGCHQVTTAEDVVYTVYIDSTNTLRVTKSIDGGETWATQDGDIGITFGPEAMGIWFDKWTKGQSGTVIHIVLAIDIFENFDYYSFDTATDTFRNAKAAIKIANETWDPVESRISVTVAKAESGRLWAGFQNDGLEEGFYSDNDGTTWNTFSFTGLSITTNGWLKLCPGPFADPDDIGIIHGTGGSILSAVADASAGSLRNRSGFGSMAQVADIGASGACSVAQRHSDGAILVTWFTERNSATGDFKSITLAGDDLLSTTAGADLHSNVAGSYYCTLCINQNDDGIEVVYTGTDADTEAMPVTKAYRKTSTDGMASWSAEQAYSENAVANKERIAGPLSVASGESGTLCPVWFKNTITRDISVNANNAVLLGPAVPAAGGVTHIPKIPSIPNIGSRGRR
jgi:hypothetical protein